jgi:hypothetical protein
MTDDSFGSICPSSKSGEHNLCWFHTHDGGCWICANEYCGEVVYDVTGHHGG